MESIEGFDTHQDGTFKVSDCDRLFITVNAMVRGPFIPQKALTRHQFMELIIRGSIEKFYASQQVDTELDAVQMFISDHLSKCPKSTPAEWRRQYTMV